jgi:N-acetylglucosamine malate deacetylase 1
MKKVLVVSVHADDETLGCGGTILKHKELGDDIYWLIVTAPPLNRSYGFQEEMIKKREKEIEEVSKMYGFKKTIVLGFPPQILDEVSFREIVVKIDGAINEIQPNILYSINRSDAHSDHRIAFQAVFACTKTFRKPFIEKVLMYETLSATEFAPALIENAFIPNVFVDISAHMKKKLAIMSIFSSEVMRDNLPRSYSAINALATYRGSHIDVKYAEAFMLLFEKI